MATVPLGHVNLPGILIATGRICNSDKLTLKLARHSSSFMVCSWVSSFSYPQYGKADDFLLVRYFRTRQVINACRYRRRYRARLLLQNWFITQYCTASLCRTRRRCWQLKLQLCDNAYDYGFVVPDLWRFNLVLVFIVRRQEAPVDHS